MKRMLTILIIVIAVGIASVFVFQTVKKKKQRHTNTTGQVISVNIETVMQYEFQKEIDAVGTLRAREICPLSPKVAGNIIELPVDIGDRVTKGQTVVRLDCTTYEFAVEQAGAACIAAEAAVGQARALFEQAEKEYRRASNLLADEIIPESRFDAAEAACKAARATLASAKGQYNQAGAALKTAQEHLKDTEIRSPIAGVVVDRSVEVGESIAPGAQALRILDQSMLKVDVELPELDLGRIVLSTPVEIMVDAYKTEKFQGKVTVVNPMVDSKTRTFRVRVEAPNPGEKLVDGMFARVRLLAEKRMALAVSRDALRRIPGSGTFYVFVVQGNKALKRTIKIGFVGDRYAEVLDNLTEGESVVVSGAGRLRSGIGVKAEADIR